jgi:protein TonB
MAGASTQLARETPIDAVYNDPLIGSVRLEDVSKGHTTGWPSWLRGVKETVAAERETVREYFSGFLLNVLLLIVAVLVTVMIIGFTGMLHKTGMTVKKKESSDLHMVLPEKEAPPPVKMEDELILEEPEMIYTVKNVQKPQAERTPPKINFPQIEFNAKLPTGLDIGMTMWNISPPKSEYGMGEVDQVPIATFQVPPNYPYHAKRQGTEGVVSIRFLVNRVGEVSSFSVIKATPDGVFDEAARRSVLRWKFKPGVKDGEAVDTWVEMDIEFDLG